MTATGWNAVARWSATAGHARTAEIRVRRAWLGLALWMLCATPGCVDEDFARPSRVQSWRALALVADPPVVGTEASPSLRALVVQSDGRRAVHGEDGVRFAWRSCIVEETGGSGGFQYDAEGPERGCGSAPALVLPTAADGSTRFPADQLAAAIPEGGLAELAALLGVPETWVEAILTRVGVVVTVELRVEQAGHTRLRAFKRIVLHDRSEAGLATNPPAPRFGMRRLGEPEGANVWIRGGAPGAFACAWEGAALALEAGATYVLDPEDVPEVGAPESWLERYGAVDRQGQLVSLPEQPYYAWYATEGRLDQEQTTPPADEELWEAPQDPGIYPLWVVVRDGHAGMSACQIDVDVVAPADR